MLLVILKIFKNIKSLELNSDIYIDENFEQVIDYLKLQSLSVKTSRDLNSFDNLDDLRKLTIKNLDGIDHFFNTSIDPTLIHELEITETDDQ